MDNFRSLDLVPIIDTSSSDIINDFFVPILSRAVKYDRGVGYFSSGWLRVAAQGMNAFASNGGKARWVTSPILDERDWDALKLGDAARTNEFLKEILNRHIEDLADALENETLSALAWMVADEIITIKLALPMKKLEGGEFHDKFGVFLDGAGNRISFNGSYNDSIKGTRNYESIKIFYSWHEHSEVLTSSDHTRFEKLWQGLDPNVKVYELPEATKERILKLRNYSRPYLDPEQARLKGLLELGDDFVLGRPVVPDEIALRDYQEEAIEAWFSNGCRGFFEMATGTGKTITALGAAVRLFERESRLAVVIAVPFQHLVDQWKGEVEKFGFQPILAYQSRHSWLDKLHERALAFSHQDTDNLCVIVTHATFSTEHFQESINRIDGSNLLIADEVHHLGAKTRKQYLPDEMEYRLALSATPDRWYDESGTADLRDYFGETVFELPLADAIGLSLTPYYYFPVLVELTPSELEEYRNLSKQIARLFARKDVDFDDERLTQLLIKRADLLNAAENKLPTLSDLVDQQEEMHHTLFYCSHHLINEVVQLIGWEKRIGIHRFTAREDAKTRQKILNEFAEGKLKALAAMHCLDEGVDVPSTRTAYILASSSNPRQFIQRRGRVLRRAEGKEYAVLYDLITVPPPSTSMDEAERKAEQSILRRELRRFAEFADSAINTQAAYDVIWDLASQFGVMDF